MGDPGGKLPNRFELLGLRELARHVCGELGLAEAIALAQRETRRYAKRTFKKARRRTRARELGRLTELVEGERRIKEERPLLFRITDGCEEELAHSVLTQYGASAAAPVSGHGVCT